MWLDIRQALRSLRRSPGVALAALLTMAVGIGPCAAAYGILDAVILSALPYPDAERVVVIKGQHGQAFIMLGGDAEFALNLPTLAESPAVEAISVCLSGRLNVGRQAPERVRAASVTAGFFATLGVKPVLGSAFSAEGAGVADPVVVIGDRFWRGRFHADPAVVGQSLVINSQVFTVVGVMPPGVEFPDGSELWIPSGADGQVAGNVKTPTIICRMAPGTSINRVRDEVIRATALRYGQPFAPSDVHVVTLRQVLTGDVKPILVLCSLATLMVLLVASLNAGNLLLTRTIARGRELAVREALGASRGRVVRLVVAENLMLACASVGVATLLAAWVLGVARSWVPPTLHGARDMAFNLRVVGALGVLALVSVSISAAGPLLALKGGLVLGRGGPGAPAKGLVSRARAIAVVAEVAVAFTVLAAAATLVGTVSALLGADTGLQVDRVVVGEVVLPTARYGSMRGVMRFHERLETELQAAASIEATGVTSQLPGAPDAMITGNRIHIDGMPMPVEGRQFATRLLATPGYFAASGITRLSGRLFTSADRQGAEPVVIVSASVVEAVEGRSAEVVGRRFSFGKGQWATIVGVVGDVRLRGPESPFQRAIYLPYAQQTQAGPMHIVLKGRGRAERVAQEAAAALARVDPELPLGHVRTLAEVQTSTFYGRYFAMSMVGVCGALTLALAALGLLSVIAHVVHLRTKEIGIRMTLGATPSTVLLGVLRAGLVQALAGTAIGAVMFVWLRKILDARIVGLEHAGPVALTAVALAVVATAALVTLLPASRAARIDPVTALRAE